MSDRIVASHRMRMSSADAHYGGNLVAGGHLMELIGDLATELCVRSDGDEGLLAGYSSVEFLAPVHAGDFIEVKGTIVAAGQSSRKMEFEVVRYAGARPEVSDSAADLLEEHDVVVRAVGTCVVKKDRQRRNPEGSGA